MLVEELTEHMKVISLFQNESQLLKKAAQSNRKAQQELYERYAPKMLSVARMYIRDVHQAEEVMLAGFFKVFTRLKDFRGEGSFEGWIRRIVIRECISFLRRRDQLDFQEDLVLVEEAGSNGVEAQLEVEEIQRMIDELPQGYRVVFVMYAIEGYKHREIAEILGIDIGSSKSQLFKARKLLQRKLLTLNQAEYGTSRV